MLIVQNAPIKIQRLSEWIKKTRLNHLLSTRNPFQILNFRYVKGKEIERDIPSNSNEKKSEVAIVILDKAYFTICKIVRDRQELNNAIKVSFQRNYNNSKYIST